MGISVGAGYAGQSGQAVQTHQTQPSPTPQDTLRTRFSETKQALQVAHQLIAQIENSVDITPNGGTSGEAQKGPDTLTALSFDIKDTTLALVERLHRLLQRL